MGLGCFSFVVPGPSRPRTLWNIETSLYHWKEEHIRGLSACTGKHCIFGHLGLVFIWSCFVFCLLFLLFYVICALVPAEGTHIRSRHLSQPCSQGTRLRLSPHKKNVCYNKTQFSLGQIRFYYRTNAQENSTFCHAISSSFERLN